MDAIKTQQKYPKSISRFERTTGRHAIWRDKVTGVFKMWLCTEIRRKNKKPVNNHYNYILLKFFLDFLNKHTYFAKKSLVGIYIEKAHSSVDEEDEIKKEFGRIIRQHVKYDILEKYSYYNYKINKVMLRDFYAIGN